MSEGVFGEMIAADKRAVTDVTYVAFFTRVGAIVTRQFIRSCKFLVTVLPCATERLLTCMQTTVNLEMRVLEVHLTTAWLFAPKGPSL